MRVHGPVLVAGYLLALVVAPVEATSRQAWGTYYDPNRLFSISVPSGWEATGAAGETLVLLSQRRKEAHVVIERHVLRVAIDGVSVERFAEMELEELKRRQSGAFGFARVDAAGSRGDVVMDYRRTGLSGNERLRQYSVLHGTAVYRITCLAHENLFDRYLATCGKMRDTLQFLAPPAALGERLNGAIVIEPRTPRPN